MKKDLTVLKWFKESINQGQIRFRPGGVFEGLLGVEVFVSTAVCRISPVQVNRLLKKSYRREDNYFKKEEESNDL